MPMLDKLALIDSASEELTQSRTVWPHEVRSVVAHYVHFGLLWRPSLAVLLNTFAFVQQRNPGLVPLWPRCAANSVQRVACCRCSRQN